MPMPNRDVQQLRDDVSRERDGAMSADLLTLLRDRIATHFYDELCILDRIARAILRETMHLS
jgi:hypothetical protein